MITRTKTIAAPLPVLLLALAGCASPGAAPGPAEVPEHVLEVELREFQQAQQVFREQNIGTHQFEFEGHGRVTVREILLEGFPGGAYLKCRFHYQNRTTKPVVQSWVSLDVLDQEGRIVSSQSCHLVVPTPQPIGRGSYYADELRTPTYAVHLQDGWGWRIRCDSELVEAEEPLNPPVEQPTRSRLSAPVIIRNRGQNQR